MQGARQRTDAISMKVVTRVLLPVSYSAGHSSAMSLGRRLELGQRRYLNMTLDERSTQPYCSEVTCASFWTVSRVRASSTVQPRQPALAGCAAVAAARVTLRSGSLVYSRTRAQQDVRASFRAERTTCRAHLARSMLDDQGRMHHRGSCYARARGDGRDPARTFAPTRVHVHLDPAGPEVTVRAGVLGAVQQGFRGHTVHSS